MNDRRDELETGLLELVAEVVRELHPGQFLPELLADSDLEKEAGLDRLGRVELMLWRQRHFAVSVSEAMPVYRIETPRSRKGPLLRTLGHLMLGNSRHFRQISLWRAWVTLPVDLFRRGM